MSAMPTPLREQEVAEAERGLLVQRLKRFRRIALEGEAGRVTRDRRGFKLSRSIMWDEGITRGRQAITANIALALVDRRNGSLTRNRPSPMVEAVAGADEEGAQLLQGALLTNWRETKMQEKFKQGLAQATYTRPVAWYSYWDQDLRGGLGDRNTRLIPGWRLIVDDRVLHVRDMEFVGFREEATRAKLITLFPDKTDEIEEAADAALKNDRGGMPGLPGNPFRSVEAGGEAALERNVVNMPLPYLGKGSVNTRRGPRTRDPLSDLVETEYLWYKDPSPLKLLRPKRRKDGTPHTELVTDEEGEIQFDVTGWEVVDTPFGPMHAPNLSPRTKPVYETVIRKKYPHWRHIAWIPGDEVILWDVAWNGPVPLAIQRDSIPIAGFHKEGTAQRLFDLALSRNVLYTIIFERLKLSLGGTWLAGQRAGLKTNKLVPEPGVVFQCNDIEAVKPFPVNPLDAAYFQLLDRIEGEMEKLLGISSVMQGEAAGRADSDKTYDKLLESSGVPLQDIGQLQEETIADWCEQGVWFFQNYYTDEHKVEVENLADGSVSWRVADALFMRGDYAVYMETGSQVSYSESAMFQRAQQYASLGFYALPMLGKIGHVPFWRQGLKQKMQIMADPQKAGALLGPGGGTPAQANTVVRAGMHRTHHAPGR